MSNVSQQEFVDQVIRVFLKMNFFENNKTRECPVILKEV